MLLSVLWKKKIGLHYEYTFRVTRSGMHVMYIMNMNICTARSEAAQYLQEMKAHTDNNHLL